VVKRSEKTIDTYSKWYEPNCANTIREKNRQESSNQNMILHREKRYSDIEYDW
jgi:hypothetical protein